MNETASLEIYLPYIFLVAYYLIMFRLWLQSPPKDPLAHSDEPNGKLATPAPDSTLTRVSTDQPITKTKTRASTDALAEIHILDDHFDEDAFLNGALHAFEIILKAYAEGDRLVLESLLDIGPLSVFNAMIMQRQHKHQTLTLFLVGIDETQIVGCEVEGTLATITVRFVSDMIASTHAEDGTVIDGDPGQIARMTDRWTFRRDMSSSDPNWKLAATRS